ncbi:MAG TPA: hypothetical protein VN901_15585 [Candidatus Acidoferrales bacterium]|nr:hypothetical protein [Candidatus Acidoferrales bacterium]
MRRFVYWLACFAFVVMVRLAFFLAAMAAATIHVPAPQPTVEDGSKRPRLRRHRPRRPRHRLRDINFNKKAIPATSPAALPAIINGSKTSTAKVEANPTGCGK